MELEGQLLDTRNVLLVCEPLLDDRARYNVLAKWFCGQVFHDVNRFNEYARTLKDGKILVYVCGHTNESRVKMDRSHVARVFVIHDMSSDVLLRTFVGGDDEATHVNVGEVPINVHGVAVMFPKFFHGRDFFRCINEEHVFQDLKLSNKPGTAFRKGIYLTPVEKLDDGSLKFRLLRCSTNLSGPSDNFKATDKEVVGKVDQMRPFFMPGSTSGLNHVLAQTYHNSVNEEGKQKKATIKAHSDKTKDMPRDGVMAFCTFYQNYDGNTFVDAKEKGWKQHPNNNNDDAHDHDDAFDWIYGKGMSILTRLKFQLKPQAAAAYPHLTKSFHVALYPNSVLMMSLETNRLYTHEIVPSAHDVDKIPVRLGYVVRCSETDAIHSNGKTMIASANGYCELQDATPDGQKQLSQLYYLENTSIQVVDYKDKFFFSMNNGDYMAPLL